MPIDEKEKEAILKQFMAKAVEMGSPYQESLDIVKNAGADFKAEVLGYITEAIEAVKNNKLVAIEQFNATKQKLSEVKEDVEAL